MINKAQLFEQLAGKSSVVDIDGVGEIEVRGLSFADVQEIQLRDVDPMESSLHFIVKGLMNPKLTEEDISKLKESSPNKLFAIAKVIQEISGLTDSEDFLDDTGQNS